MTQHNFLSCLKVEESHRLFKRRCYWSQLFSFCTNASINRGKKIPERMKYKTEWVKKKNKKKNTLNQSIF